MNIDVRKVIVNTLFTISTKSGIKTITWDDVANYIYMLEKKSKRKVQLVYDSNFNISEYEKLITPRVEEDNVYFDLNPNNKFSTKIVDLWLLLGKQSNEKLVEKCICKTK